MEVTCTPPYTYMSGRDHSASLSVGHRCLGTQVPDRGLAEVLTSPNKSYTRIREGTRGAGEAWDDVAAAFNDGESPYCLAHRLCRASFAGFGSGRALLAGGVMGTRGDRGDDGAAAFDDGGSPNCLTHR